MRTREVSSCSAKSKHGVIFLKLWAAYLSFLAKLILLVIIETDILFKLNTSLSFKTLCFGVFVETTEGLKDIPVKPLITSHFN